MRILVVDDHQMFLDGLGYILPRLEEGIEIEQAGNAASAMECIVLDGETYVPSGIDRGRGVAVSACNGSCDDGITKRQLEVLRLLAMGYSNRDIARTLFITEHTVKAHVGALFHALHVGNRTQCVRIAEDRGLLPDRL